MTRLVALIAVLGAAGARAQELPALEVERLQLNPSGQGGVLVGNGAMLPVGAARFTAMAHYQHEPLVAIGPEGERLGAVLRDRLTLHLASAYAVHERLELALQLPIIAYQSGDDLTAAGLARVSDAGLGTPYVSARFGLLRSLSVGLAVGFPLGTAEALARDDGFVFRPGLQGGMSFGKVQLAADVAARFRPAIDVGFSEPLSHQLDVALAASWASPHLRPELSVHASVPLNGLTPSTEVLAGARALLPAGLEAFVLGGPGLSALPGTPDFRVLVGAAIGPAPEPPPAPDPCAPGRPHTPEQCPALDDDQDGLLNRDDACPVEKGEPRWQGCPPPDKDLDGVLDAEDACPIEAGPAERKGCPVRDRDQDGVADELDECPGDPGPAQRAGCP